MKAYSVSIRFDLPQAGVIPIAANSADEAKEKMKALMINCRNVEILEAVEVPFSSLTDYLPRHEMVEDAEIVEDAEKKDMN